MSVTTGIKERPFSWSFSALNNYETCPKRYYNYNVSKAVVEPEGDALVEGKRIHDAFATRVSKGTELPLGLTMHEPMLAKLATSPGEIKVEQKLAINSAFAPVAWGSRDAWLRVVVDYLCLRPNMTASIVDYKTGRPSEDMTQISLCAAVLFSHVPKLQRVRAALLFVSHGTAEYVEFVRDQQSEIWNEILPRVGAMLSARQKDDYPPKPGPLCRRWCAVTGCPYHGR